MNVLHRRMSNYWAALERQKGLVAQEKEILNWIGLEQQDRHKAKPTESLVGRCGWFFNNKVYKNWETGSPTSSRYILICSGPGKIPFPWNGTKVQRVPASLIFCSTPHPDLV